MPHHTPLYQGNTTVRESYQPPRAAAMPQTPQGPMSRFVEYGPLYPGQQYIPESIGGHQELNELILLNQMRNFGRPVPPQYDTPGFNLMPWDESSWINRLARGFGGPELGLDPTGPQPHEAGFLAGLDWSQRHLTEPTVAAISSQMARLPDMPELPYSESSEIPSWLVGTTPGWHGPLPVDIRGLAGSKNLDEFVEKKEQYQAEGLSRSQAETKAYRETEFNPGFKGTMEIVFDPAGMVAEAVIPGGLLAKPVLGGVRAGGRLGGRAAASGLSKADEAAKALGRSVEDMRALLDPRYGLVRDIQRYQFSPDELTALPDVPQVSPIYGYQEGIPGIPVGTEIIPGSKTRTVGQVFPEGTSAQQSQFWELEKAAGRTETQWMVDPPRLKAQAGQPKPRPKYKTRTTTIHSTGDSAITGPPRWFEMPVVMQRLLNHGILGESRAGWIGPMSDPTSILQTGRFPYVEGTVHQFGDPVGRPGIDRILTSDEYDDIKTFIQHYGVNPWSSGDEALGRFRVNPTTGERHWVIGAFDNPFAEIQTDQRYYVTYSPESKEWGVSLMPEETPNLIDVQTGDNITDQIKHVIKKADDDVSLVDAEQSTWAIGSERYKQLQGQRVAIESKRHADISRLEARPSEPIFERRKPSSTLEEKEAFSKQWGDLYEKELQPTIAKRDPYDPSWNPEKGARDFTFRPAKNAGRRQFNDILMIEMGKTSNPTIWDAHQAAIKRMAREQGLPEPPVPYGKAGKDLPPDDSVGALDNIVNPGPGSLSGDDAAAMWFGARGVAHLKLRTWWDNGNKILSNIKLNGENLTKFKGRYIITKEMGRPILRALYDGQGLKGPAPEGFEDIWAKLGQLRDEEQAAYLAFDPDLTDQFMFNPDYFPRIWKRMNKATGEFESYADIVARYADVDINEIPSYLRPRSKASFDEMIEEGFEPVSWNPVDLMAVRRKMGVEHRETMILVDRLKKNQIAKEIGMKAQPEEGYRVPKVGPAFEGYKVQNKYLASADVGRYQVPNKIADVLESIYGEQTKLPFWKSDDIMPAIRLASSVPKRALLTLTGFQHIDMLFRGWAAAFSPTALKSGKTWKAAPFTLRVLASSFFSGDAIGLGRKAARRRSLDETAMFDDFNISRKMIADAGWNIQGDVSVIKREALDALKDIERGIKPGVPRIVLDRLGNTMRWWESGLFEGVYRESQMFMLDNFIVPKLRKKFPTATPWQIARRAADEVNILSSSVGDWQSIFKSPAMKDISRTALFSSNEAESWVGAVSRTLPGIKIGGRQLKDNYDAKGLYGEYWVGYLTFLAALGNAINYSVTGEFLPWDAYSPIEVARDSDGNVPFRVGYNSRFMSPQIGTGREGQPIYLDIVGQADTPFAFLLNPKQALTARFSPFISAFRPFVTKETYFGEPLEGIGEQSLHAVMQFLPIGASNAAQLGREHGPLQEQLSQFIPEAESGLGTSGYLIQSGGFNVRKERTADLLNELANLEGFESVPKEWNDPSTWIANPTPYEQLLENYGPSDKRRAWDREDDPAAAIVAELEHRRETGVDRGYEYQQINSAQSIIDNERIDAENALVNAIATGKISLENWYEEYTDLQTKAFNEKRGIDKVFKRFEEDRDLPKNPLERARHELYQAKEDSQNDYGAIGWDVFNEKLAELNARWTPEQQEHIATIENKDHSVWHDSKHANGWLVNVLNEKDKYKWYDEIPTKYFKGVGMYDTYKDYQTSNFKTRFLKDNPDFASHLKFVQETKKSVRESNPGLMQILFLTGRVSGHSLERVLGAQ